MTLPILPIPNTQPQYSHNVPGLGNVVGDQLQQLLTALMVGTQTKQRQQQLEQSGEYQRSLIANEEARQAQELAKTQAAMLRDSLVGQAVNRIGEPTSVSVPGEVFDVPGQTVSLPGAPMSPEQAAKNLPSHLVGEFYKQGKDRIEVARKTAKEREQEAVMRATIAELPKWMRPAAQASAQMVRAGMAGEAGTAFAALLGAPDATRLAEIDHDYPELITLNPSEKAKAVLGISQALAEKRLGVGAEARRQAETRLGEARLQLSKARLAMDRAKDPGGKLSAVLALLRLVDASTSDLTELALTDPKLIGRPVSERVTALFGASGLKAYNDAIEFLKTQVPTGPTQPPKP